MLIDGFEGGANFVSKRALIVAAPAGRVWEVLPQLPVALRHSRLAALAVGPLLVAAALRRDMSWGDRSFGTRAWRLREGMVLIREVVLLGRHRFASYASCFTVTALSRRRSRAANVTRATFVSEGLGSLYLAGVRVFHDPYTDWMLRVLKHLAES